jgi:CheY-like chemotaxis protein
MCAAAGLDRLTSVAASRSVLGAILAQGMRIRGRFDDALMTKVLVVEDEADFLRTVIRTLDSAAGDFATLTAKTGEEALEILRTQPADILLTDVRLPGIDGIELVRRALAVHPTIKVIVMSALTSPDVQARAIKGGALRFLAKPFKLSDLVALLHDVAALGGWSGSVTGLDIFDLTQLLAMTQRSRAVRIRAGAKSGVLVLEDGQIVHATANGRVGAEAFSEMVGWEGGIFEDLPRTNGAAYPRNVDVSTTQLIMEAARRRDEAHLAHRPAESQAQGPLHARLKELLAGCSFSCDACLLAPEGSIVAIHQGRAGTRRTLADLADSLHTFASALNRGQVRRLLIEDDQETVVLCDVAGEGDLRLLVATDTGPRVGSVLSETRRVAQALLSTAEQR